MKNTDVFNNFDMVVSITEKALNDQLTHLLSMGTIHPEMIIYQTYDKKLKQKKYKVCESTDEIPLNEEGNPKYPTIAVEIQPQVAISSSGKIVTFILKFLEGYVWFYDEPGPDGEIVKYDATGWQYAININMDLRLLPKDELGNIKAPDFVKKQLNDFSTNMFDINHLFMDFQSTDLMNFDPKQTSTPSGGDFGKEQFVVFMSFYLEWLTKSGNPFILGYSITQNDETKVAADEKVPDSIRPTGTTYTMFHDNVNQTLSTLNFALVTKGGYGTIKHTPDNFDDNWITPDDQCDAKMIYAASRFSEEFILKPLFNKLCDDTYGKLQGKLTLPPKATYNGAKTTTATGYKFVIADHNIHSDIYKNSFEVAIINQPAEVHYNVSGRLFVYKGNTIDFGVCDATASGQTLTEWHAQFIIRVEKDAEGNPVLKFDQSFSIDKHEHSTDKNDCCKFWDGFGSFLAALFSILDVLDLGSITSAITNIFRNEIPGLGDIGVVFSNMDNSFNSAVMLPAGGVFFFKNPVADAPGNISLSLTYKSATEVALQTKKFQEHFHALKSKRKLNLASMS